ncbi:hypothetical protein [Nostoc sp.]|uniref:hypothetical protein n=1 Tax=Nostoc sp. TaxID=1180 RepID=UPI002FF67C21
MARESTKGPVIQKRVKRLLEALLCFVDGEFEEGNFKIKLPAAELFSLWQDTVHELCLRTRRDLLQDIKALFPVIFALGGEAATVEIACAIVDVGRWWK